MTPRIKNLFDECFNALKKKEPEFKHFEAGRGARADGIDSPTELAAPCPSHVGHASALDVRGLHRYFAQMLMLSRNGCVGHAVALVAIAVVLGGCSGSSNPASAAGDGAGTTTGAAGGSTGGGSTGGGDAASALVARCQALANNLATKCTEDAERTCLWDAYAKLCATGQTQLLIDSMNCFDGSTCMTFSDANDSATCLGTVHGTGDSAAAKAYIDGVCDACGLTCSAASGTAELFPYLNDADIAALAQCTASAMCGSLAAFEAACRAVPDVAPFAACNP